MANEIRTRFALQSGTITDNPLSSGATTFNSSALSSLGVIDTTNYCAIVIDSEVMWITSHSASATSATILRGQEGTSAASHTNGAAWTHCPTIRDFTDSARGQLAYNQVTTAQNGITTSATDLTGLTAQIWVPANRRIRLTGFGVLAQQTSAGVVTLQIMEGATELVEADYYVATAGSYATANAMVILTPSAGTHTYKLQARTSANTVNLAAATTGPAFILAEDIGSGLVP